MQSTEPWQHPGLSSCSYNTLCAGIPPCRDDSNLLVVVDHAVTRTHVLGCGGTRDEVFVVTEQLLVGV